MHMGLQALEHDKANDLMFWASSYNLFVTWSVNGQHSWDNVTNASKPAATLEIGSLRGTNKVRVISNLLHISLPKSNELCVHAYMQDLPISMRRQSSRVTCICGSA